MNKLVYMLGLTLALSGCDAFPKYNVYVEHADVEVTEIDPPKHYRIMMKDTNGYVIKSASKHCSDWENVKEGDKFQISYTRYVYEDGGYQAVGPSACDIARSLAVQ